MSAEPPRKKGRFVCDTCGKSYEHRQSLHEHQEKHSQNPRHVCDRCRKAFQRASHLQAHVRSVHRRREEQEQPQVTPQRQSRTRPVVGTIPLPPRDPYDPQDCKDVDTLILQEVDEVSQIYLDNWDVIRTEYVPYKKGKVLEYNLRLPNSEISLRQFIEAIHSHQTTAYSINIRIGYVTMNVETGETTYWYPGAMSKVFDNDRRINNKTDLDAFQLALSEHDLYEFAQMRRPNTKCAILLITNAQVMLTIHRNVPIKGLKGTLPAYIKKRASLISLDSKPNGTPYDDSLCLFRCLALHKQRSTLKDGDKFDKSAMEKTAQEYAEQWFDFRQIPSTGFEGIQIAELDDVELLFEVAIYVYQLQPMVEEIDEIEYDEELLGQNVFSSPPVDKLQLENVAIANNEFVAELIRRPNIETATDNALFLHLFEKDNASHFSYIKNFFDFAKAYKCSKCGKLDNSRAYCKAHEVKCKGCLQKQIFPGGAFSLPPTVFEMLNDEPNSELHLPDDSMRFYPYFATWDCESFSKNLTCTHFESLMGSTIFPPETLPSEDENQFHGADIDGFISTTWHELKTTYSITRGRYVIRTADINRVPAYVHEIAKRQVCRFQLCLSLLVKRSNLRELKKRRLFHSAPVIYNEYTLRCAIDIISVKLAEWIHSREMLFGVEICVQTGKQTILNQQQLASIAIATNVPGYADASGSPRAHILISDGDSGKLVKKFLLILNEISATAESLLLETFAPIIERLKSRILFHSTYIERVLGPLINPEEGRRKRPTFYARLKACRDQLSADDVASLRFHKETEARLSKILDMLDDWISHCPVIGFNSGFFDVNLIRKELLPLLVSEGKKDLSILRKDGSMKYLQLKTKRLIFLDQCNFLAQGCSYAQWLKAYKIEQKKGHWPYEYFTSLDQLKLGHLPPIEAFDNQLKGSSLSLEEYSELQKIWKERGMKNLSDFLIWYSELDVLPFVQCCEKMRRYFMDARGVCMYKQAVSIPSLALRIMFNLAEPFTFVVLPQKVKGGIDNSDIHELITEGITGGPSIVFNRYAEVGVTKIRSADGGTEIVKKIMGIDCASLYLFATMQRQPVGIGRRWRREDDNSSQFICTSMYPNSQSELEWLCWEEYDYNRKHPASKIKILHKFNHNKQIRVCSYPVDGICRRLNRIYQYYGCHVHVCKEPYCESGSEFSGVEERRTRQDQDECIVRQLRQNGYSVHIMPHCKWAKLKRTNDEIREFVNQYFALPKKRRNRAYEHELLQRIENGDLFGIALVDIETPESLKEHYSEFPPIFKNVSLSRDQIGDFMKSFAEKEGIMQQPRRCLVSSYFGKRILLSTPLLQWYITHGLTITRIHEIVEYKGRSVFRSFGDEVIAARRAADSGGTQEAIKSELEKLIGNSGYGKTNTRVERHKHIEVCNRIVADKLEQSPRWSQTDEVTPDVYEVSMIKPSVLFNLPRIIGFMVYAYAKLRMLEIYYDCLDKYCLRKDWELLFMDTDSFYMALAGNSIDDIVQPHLIDEYRRVRNNFFPDPQCLQWSSRTPGIAKVEYDDGIGAVALNSKTYICWKADPTQDKRSSKGLPKRNALTKQDYMHVLDSKEPKSGIVRSFRRMKLTGELSRIDQIRFGLTYFYPKREVLADGHSTRVLKDV